MRSLELEIVVVWQKHSDNVELENLYLLSYFVYFYYKNGYEMFTLFCVRTC